jgi:hypothetical protein
MEEVKMRCINPTDPVVGEPPEDPTGGEGEIQAPGGSSRGFCGTGGKPVELPEWQKTYLAERKQHFHRLLYEVTKGIESQKVWRDLVWAEALGKDLASIDHRIKKIRLGETPEEESASSGWDTDHSKTVRVAVQLLFLDWIKNNPTIRQAFTSVSPEREEGDMVIPKADVGWRHFRSSATGALEMDFVDAADVASEKAGRTQPEKRHPTDLPREPWWAWYEKQPRSRNPRVSYWDGYSNRDVFTAHPSPTHLRGLKNSQQVEIEPWLDKSQLPTIVADEMFVRDIARKTNGGARRCRNPWYFGVSREGIGEVFWSKHPKSILAAAQMMGKYADRHLGQLGPFASQREAEDAAIRSRGLTSEMSGMPRPEGPGYQILGKRAGPRVRPTYPDPTKAKWEVETQRVSGTLGSRIITQYHLTGWPEWWGGVDVEPDEVQLEGRGKWFAKFSKPKSHAEGSSCAMFHCSDNVGFTPSSLEEGIAWVEKKARENGWMGSSYRKENPWFLGYSRDGIKEVFWSRRKPTAKSHGVRYDLTAGPYPTQREAEAQTLGGGLEGGGFYQVIGRRAKPRSFHSYRGDPQCWPGHYEEFGYEWPPEGGRYQERGLNPRSMNPQDKAFALKHNIPASTWNDSTFQRELRSYIERHGTYPRSVYRVRVPEGFPRYMSAWGKSPNVLYDAPQHSNKGKRIHHFGEDKGKGKKPWLVSSQEKGPRFLAYVGGEFEADGEWIRY